MCREKGKRTVSIEIESTCKDSYRECLCRDREFVER